MNFGNVAYRIGVDSVSKWRFRRSSNVEVELFLDEDTFEAMKPDVSMILLKFVVW